MTKRILTLTVLVLFTSSCRIYHVNSVDRTEAFYPQKSIEEVAYLEDVERPHEVIGTVTVNAERNQRTFEDVIIKMRREAAILGGDAVTNIQTDATGVWKRLPAQPTIGNAYVRANFTAEVVVFKE